jgi:hypothetical protein
MSISLKTAAALALAVAFAVTPGYATEAKATKPAKKQVAAKSTKPAAAKSAKKTKAAPPSVEDQIQALRHQLDSQASQLDSMKSDLAEKDARLKKAEQAAAEAQSAAEKANSNAVMEQKTVTENAAAVSTLQSSVTDLKESQTKVTEETVKLKKEVTSPDGLHYKGIKITPGGYMQLATIYRQRNTNSDTADNYGQYPYANSADYYMSEFRATGRATRLSLKADGTKNNMKFMGYVEIDFLGASGGNETQTNSFSPRLRLAFANVDLPGGWSIAGGQNWSMLQLTRKGIAPLTEWVPSVIDNSYTPGFSYARQGGFRVVKQITPKLWAGFSVENPDTVATSACSSSFTCGYTYGQIQGYANSTSTTSPNSGYLNATSGSGSVTGNPSVNPIPDLVAKVAFEPGWGHYEIKAIGRRFRDRVYPNYFNGSAISATPTNGASYADAKNYSSDGGGIGFSAILPLVQKKLDFDFQGLAGAGIGRYGATSGPDVTYNADGKMIPVRGMQMVAGLEIHPTPRFDLNLYGGGDYYQRVSYFIPKGSDFFGWTTTANAEVGYGYQFANDSGCSTEGSSTCAGNAKEVLALQPQFWYRIYKGKEGAVQFGASYAYVWKEAWAGRGANGSAVTALPDVTGLISPKAINQIVMTSFRYYLP